MFRHQDDTGSRLKQTHAGCIVVTGIAGAKHPADSPLIRDPSEFNSIIGFIREGSYTDINLPGRQKVTAFPPARVWTEEAAAVRETVL